MTKTAPLLPIRIDSSELLVGQEVSVEYVYSAHASTTYTGLVTLVDLDWQWVRLQDMPNQVWTVPQPKFDVEVTLLAQAPEPDPTPRLAWVRELNAEKAVLCSYEEGHWEDGVFGNYWVEVSNRRRGVAGYQSFRATNPDLVVTDVVLVHPDYVVIPVEDGKVVLGESEDLRLPLARVGDDLYGGLGGHFYEALGRRFGYPGPEHW